VIVNVVDGVDAAGCAGVPAYSFWPQALVNGTWSATPVNLVEPMDYFGTTRSLQR
jgi:hypothetical protein